MKHFDEISTRAQTNLPVEKHLEKEFPHISVTQEEYPLDFSRTVLS